jgi:hypothetical protein
MDLGEIGAVRCALKRRYDAPVRDWIDMIASRW